MGLTTLSLRACGLVARHAEQIELDFAAERTVRASDAIAVQSCKSRERFVRVSLVQGGLCKIHEYQARREIVCEDMRLRTEHGSNHHLGFGSCRTHFFRHGLQHQFDPEPHDVCKGPLRWLLV